MFLVATTNTLEAVLDAAPSAQWPILIAYADLTATAFNGGQQVTNTNGTTPVTVLAAPAASTVRQVKTINAYNAGNADRTLTIRLDVSGVESVLWSGIVPVGKTLTWNADKGWSLGDTALSASNITFTPTGNVAATNVQNAIAEVDSEKVAKAGDTMTGALNINYNEASPATNFMLAVTNTNAGTLGAFIDVYHNSASPANADLAGGIQFSINNSAIAKTFGAVARINVVDITAAAESVEFQIRNRWAGVNTTNFGVGNGVVIGTPTGFYQGSGTINAVNYFDDGVNIADIYVNVSGDTMTGRLNFNTTDLYPIIVEGTDAGVNGPGIALRHLSASPAVNDVPGNILLQGRDSALTTVNYAGFSVIAGNVTAGAVAGRFQFNTSQAGTYASRVQIGAGVFVGSVTGGDQGAGTLNATALYTNANLVADTNGLIRSRVYTFGTLPAAAGVTGARAQITDGAAAPVWNAAAAGGGAVNTPVRSTGAAWVNG